MLKNECVLTQLLSGTDLIPTLLFTVRKTLKVFLALVFLGKASSGHWHLSLIDTSRLFLEQQMLGSVQ